LEKSNKNIFVLFSPGLGGNHVANLLATDIRYITRATANDYANHNEQNAHILEGNLNNIDNKNYNFGNIFCGHFSEFYWKHIENKISKYQNRQIILIDLPKDNNSIAFKRHKKYSNLSKYFFEEQRSLYSFYTLENLFNENDFFNIPCEIFFNDSVDNFFNYASKEMNFSLDYTECKKMHNIWIQKIKKELK
jgi:hypothetical protein